MVICKISPVREKCHQEIFPLFGRANETTFQGRLAKSDGLSLMTRSDTRRDACERSECGSK